MQVVLSGGDLLQKKITWRTIRGDRLLIVSANEMLKASSGLLRLIWLEGGVILYKA